MMCNWVAGWVGMIVGCVESFAGYVGGAADSVGRSAGFVGRAVGSVGRAVVFVGRAAGCVGTTAGSDGKVVELVVALSAAVKSTDHWISEEWTWQEVRLPVVVGA